jgi:hypothetical protein
MPDRWKEQLMLRPFISTVIEFSICEISGETDFWQFLSRLWRGKPLDVNEDVPDRNTLVSILIERDYPSDPTHEIQAHFSKHVMLRSIVPKAEKFSC